MNLLFWKKKETPPMPSRERQRHEKDAALLAEYNAFDDAVGTLPTKDTLVKRFHDAVFDGYTEVVKDTLKKGLAAPNEFDRVEYMVVDFLHKENNVLEIAARRDWADIVEVLLPYVDKDNLDGGLRIAESRRNATIAKAIRAEMTKRAEADAPDALTRKAYAAAVKAGRVLT